MRSHEHAIEQLNDVYFGFVQSLEPPLAQLARTPATFSRSRHAGDEQPFTCLGNLKLLDISLPFMLAEVFRISRDDLFAIASSGMFGLFAVLLHDAMFDQQVPADPDRLLLQNLLYTKALSYLHVLFEPDSPFWRYHRAYFSEYFRAISAEREKHYRRISAYDKAELYEIARGKCAPRKILLAAMAVPDSKDVSKRIETLAASFDAFGIASQILDDISDWKEDFSDRRFSYLLTRVITSRGLESRIKMDARPSLWEIIEMAVHVFGSGEPQILLDEAREWFKEASCRVEGLECPEWRQFLRNCAEHCADRKHNIEALIALPQRLIGEVTVDDANLSDPEVKGRLADSRPRAGAAQVTVYLR